MAVETSDTIFLGTDLQRKFHIKNEAQTTSIDITGWALSWMLKRRKTDPDARAILTKTTAAGDITIVGTFNSSPASNAQRAVLTLDDDDTDDLTDGQYYWELKRTDTGAETVLAYGAERLRRGVHHA